MKRIFILFYFLLSVYLIAQQRPLQILWETTIYNGYNVIKLSQTGTANVTFVHENNSSITGERYLGGAGFTYIIVPSAGKYLLSFFPISNFHLWTSNALLSQDDKDKILEVRQWGNGPWNENIEQMFEDATKLKITAIDVPNLQGVKNTSSMFRNCKSIETIPNIHLWDTADIEYMRNMFMGAENFNGDISAWNVEKVYSFEYMFFNAKKFNQNVGNWNINMLRRPSLYYTFSNSGISCENYTKILQGFSKLPTSYGINLGVHNITYGLEGRNLRNILIQNKWTFSGDVFDQNCTANLNITENNQDNQVAVYPNPTNGEIFIESKINQIVQIFDQTGKVVQQENLVVGKNKIVLKFTSGLYIIKTESNFIKILKK